MQQYMFMLTIMVRPIEYICIVAQNVTAWSYQRQNSNIWCGNPELMGTTGVPKCLTGFNNKEILHTIWSCLHKELEHIAWPAMVGSSCPNTIFASQVDLENLCLLHYARSSTTIHAYMYE